MRRMLNSVYWRAEHVALQHPHWKQRLNDGTRSSSMLYRSNDTLSIFSDLGVFMANPNLFIVRAVYDRIVEIHTSGNTEYVAEFLHGLRGDGTQRTCTLAVIVGAELGRNGLYVL